MNIKQDMGFCDLMENCWSGAIDTLNTIEEHDKENELMEHLEEVFSCEIPSLTEINDYLWFDDEYIFEVLGICEEENEEEEEEEDIEYEEGITEQETVDFNQFCSKFVKCENCPYNSFCKTFADCRERYLELKYPEDNEN